MVGGWLVGINVVWLVLGLELIDLLVIFMSGVFIYFVSEVLMVKF